MMIIILTTERRDRKSGTETAPEIGLSFRKEKVFRGPPPLPHGHAGMAVAAVSPRAKTTADFDVLTDLAP
jgi:hypothetical protein